MSVLYALSALIALALPVLSVLYVKKKLNGNVKYLFGGVAIFIIFYGLLYAGAPVLLTSLDNALNSLSDSPVLYAVVDVSIRCLCVALGYFLWFRLFAPKENGANALMTGVGFGSSLIFMAYAVSNTVNTLLSAGIISSSRIKPDGTVIQLDEGFDWLGMIEENIYEIKEATYTDIFLGVLQMLCFFVLEIAAAYIFYRVLVCKNKTVWIFAALALKIGGYTVASLGALLERYWIVLILIAVSIVISGAAYSLYKPFVLKKEKSNGV